MKALYMFLLLLQCSFNQKQNFVVEIELKPYIYIYNSYQEIQHRQINSIAVEVNFTRKLLERRHGSEDGFRAWGNL